MDLEKTKLFPNAAKDKVGRLLVAAAVGVGKDGLKRAELLISAGVTGGNDSVTIFSATGTTSSGIAGALGASTAGAGGTTAAITSGFGAGGTMLLLISGWLMLSASSFNPSRLITDGAALITVSTLGTVIGLGAIPSDGA